MFALIIVALDGSKDSLRALDYAGEIAEKHGSKLILLHAYRATSDLREAEVYAQIVAKRKQGGEAILEDARRRLGPETAFALETELLEGPAADAIVKVAETQNADLIVMGTRGMGSFKGLVFGSVSTKVTQHAPCSVLVVR